jgi:hypothetical protein
MKGPFEQQPVAVSKDLDLAAVDMADLFEQNERDGHIDDVSFFHLQAMFNDIPPTMRTEVWSKFLSLLQSRSIPWREETFNRAETRH